MIQNKAQRFFLAVTIIVLCGFAFILWGGSKHKGIFGTNTVSTSTPTASEPLHGNPSSKKTYLHSDNSFTFSFSGDFTFSNLAETDVSGGQAETVLFVGNSTDRNFQIHISSYAEKAPLTPKLILHDIPDLLIESPEKIGVGGAQGVAFISGPKDGTLRTREIWFTHNGKLYQVSTYKSFDQEMVGILTSWKWQ